MVASLAMPEPDADQLPVWHAETIYGVPVLDLRPFTENVTAWSEDKRMAENAQSYSGLDGPELARQKPPSKAVAGVELRFRADGPVRDGVLFLPDGMDDKWALYVHAGRLLVVRSWHREVWLTAGIRVEGDVAIVGPIRGQLFDGASPDDTARDLAWLIRTHVFGEILPLQLASEPAADVAPIGLFSTWGRHAKLATHHAIPPSSPVAPLRTHSRLHLAAARGDRDLAAAELASGASWSARAGDGLTALQWAMDDAEMVRWALDRGAQVDARSAEGSTALMLAVQKRDLATCELLVARGADVAAADDRGFTSLHRAAEMGEVAVVELLLAHGAPRAPAARGLTPRDLAEQRGESTIVELLSRE
jgi:hypothetical protein